MVPDARHRLRCSVRVDNADNVKRFRVKHEKVRSVTYYSTGPLGNSEVLKQADTTFGNYYRREWLPNGNPRSFFGRSFFEQNTHTLDAAPLEVSENIKGFFLSLDKDFK